MIPQVDLKDVDVQILEVGWHGELQLVGADHSLIDIREDIEASSAFSVIERL